MLHQWYSNLPKDQQDQFKQQVLGSKKVLDKAVEILYNRVQSEEEIQSVDYDCPSWAFKQADRLGYLRGVRDAIKLLEIKSDKDV